MLQGFIVLFAIITFTIMACDPRPNESTRNTSAWQAEAKTSNGLTQPMQATTTETIETDQT